MTENQCASCGQWAGRGHRCPTPTATTTLNRVVVPDRADASATVEVSDRVARAQALLNNQTPAPLVSVPAEQETPSEPYVSYWDARAIETYGMPLNEVAENETFTSAADRASEGSRILIIHADDNGQMTLAESEELPQTCDLGGLIRDLAGPTNPGEAPTDPPTPEEQIEAAMILRENAANLRTAVDLIEDDLVTRLRASDIRDIHDRRTGMISNRGSAYNYSGWKTDELANEIAAKADFGEDVSPEEAAQAIAAFRTYATPDRFRTSALREIGIDAKQYSTAKYGRPTLTSRWMNETDPVIDQQTTARALAAAPDLSRAVQDIPEAREQIRDMPLDVAVREYTALRAQTRLLARTADHLESAAVRSLGDRTAVVNGASVTVVKGSAYEKWDVSGATRVVVPKVAERASLSEEKAGRVVSKWLEYASVSKFKKRDLKAAGIDSEDYVTTTPPKQKLKIELEGTQ